MHYDAIVVGGGLAGLTLAIQLADAGARVALFEKQRYPYHKVCGEYISEESFDFLTRLGVPLGSMNLPRIRRARLTAPGGRVLEQPLALGAFGLSRYRLDATLADLARQRGVDLRDGTPVRAVTFTNDQFTVRAGGEDFTARAVAGAYGRHSNLNRQQRRTPAYVGVKYHVLTDVAPDLIELHSFRAGYCGVSQIEAGRACLCYLTTAENLRRAGSIAALERDVLRRNPYLAHHLDRAEFLFDAPCTVSQVRIGPRPPVADHVLCLGDAAGFVAPLSGNGMSMALRASFLLAPLIAQFLSGEVDRPTLEATHARQWRAHFGRRVAISSFLQRLLGREHLTDTVFAALRPFPAVVRGIIRQTHGEAF